MGITHLDALYISGVPTMGVNDLPLTVGNYFWVNSNTGSDGNTGAADNPFATIDFAIGKCTASQGDTIVVEQGHAETLTSAGAIACDVAGINIIGLGNGSNRPRLTFGTSTGASVLITAANTFISNIVGISGVDGLTNPFHVQAAGVTLGNALYGPIEWQDPTNATQAVRAVLTTAAADNLRINLKVSGVTSGGTSPVNAIRLVGVDGAIINCDFFGRASTSFVEFVTTACTNIEVYGYMFNSGVTNYTKDVVDTVTGSTWFASFNDGAAGYTISGGSATALGPGGTAVVIADLAVPTADSTANALERDVIGNKTDASVFVPSSTASQTAYLKGHADLQERVALKSAATITNGQTLFTVAGGPIVIVGLVSICVTGNDATASTLQYSATPTSGSAQTISAASSSLANATAGGSVTLAGTALATAALYNASGPNLIANPGTIMVPAGTITAVVGVGSTTGTWRHYIRYRPLATGITVS